MTIPARNIWYSGGEQYEPAVRKSDYDTLATAHLKARDKLLDLAKECSSCGGTGVVTVTVTVYDEAVSDFVEDRQEPCGDCADIRAVLE